ncbi:MAG TPA: helicase C-terminal domain-containing protein [Candidatus Bathyarchaeia archaeon]|nr:helicase C-terminal domain-containing protein [Candidatus Bathyarchaeia archaeon]
MGNNQNLNLSLQSVLERYQKVEHREYQVACIKGAVESINNGADVVIDLPTGAGKTLVYAPIVADVSDNGRSALVLTATKQAQRRVNSEIRQFQRKSQPVLIYGIQEYDCPVLDSKAQNWCCGELKEELCKPKGVDCAVIQSEKNYKTSNLVVTNFSKFLLASANRKYDIIVLDDSHSFENTKEQAYQIIIHYAPVRIFYEEGIQQPSLSVMVQGFLNLFSEIFERCVNPEDKEGIITIEYIKRLAELVNSKNEEQLKQEIMRLSEPKRSMCWSIYYFIRRCKESSKYQFYVRKDFYDPQDWDSSELISRRDDIVEYIIRNRFNDSRVIFVTATPGDVNLHANSCTLRDYDSIRLEIAPPKDSHYPEIDNWFRKLAIIIVDNIGDTRQQSYFEKAIGLTTDILENRKERALVLFKNYRDQRSAYNILSKKFPSDKLFFIDVSLQDSDVIEEIASKKKISLASASSTLWEGINIKKLGLAIIISPPFIRPHVGHALNYPYFERRMLIRLQQGIGRIIRSPADFGVAVLTDNRFKRYINRRMFNQKLRERVEFLKSDKVVSRINDLFSQWGAS